jgi:hypothetical protein
LKRIVPGPGFIGRDSRNDSTTSAAACRQDTFFGFNRERYRKCETADDESSRSGDAITRRAILEFHLRPRDFASLRFYYDPNAAVPSFSAGVIGPRFNL